MANFSRDSIRRFQSMLRIRLVEELIAERYVDQEMRCPVHLSVGQEASAVGVCDALEPRDRLFTTHRCHAHYLAKGGDLRGMLAEIYGKADGCIGGRGGSMHLADPSVGVMASVPIVASSIPLAVGNALSNKLKGNDAVTVSFFGDACLEEGVFHESANFASLHDLPVIFACENNLFSVYTHLSMRQPQRPLTNLPEAHGIRSVEVDGNDVDAVYSVSEEAVARARNGEGPSFILMNTYRWREHCGPNYDDHLGYRDSAEFEFWRARDPLERNRNRLVAENVMSEADADAMSETLMGEIDEAFVFARQSPLPDPRSATLHVYAD